MNTTGVSVISMDVFALVLWMSIGWLFCIFLIALTESCQNRRIQTLHTRMNQLSCEVESLERKSEKIYRLARKKGEK